MAVSIDIGRSAGSSLEAEEQGANAHCLKSPVISVIMPVRNEERFIARSLDCLLAQHYPVGNFEVLVVDGRSDDRTVDIVRQYAQQHENIKLLDNPRRWSSAARNLGVHHARGDLLIIVDGHCELTDQDYLANLADAFGRTGVDCLGRPQPLDVSGATPLQRAIAAARSSPLGHHPDSFIYAQGERVVPAKSVAVAYRRCVFEKVGLFDESFDACEDVELNHRIDKAGLRCLFTDRIRLPYEPRGTLSGLFRQLVRYGRGRVRLMWKHPETFSLRTLIPALFLAWLVAGLPLAFIVPSFAWLYIGSLALYFLVVVGFSCASAVGQAQLRLLPLLPLVFFTIHLSAGSGMLLEAISPQRRPGS